MNTSTGVVIGVVIVVALGALALNLERDETTMPQEPTTMNGESNQNAATEANLAQVRADAVTDLAALRARVAAGETYEAVANDYTEVRARVTAAYAAAGQAASEEWQDIEAGFEAFEASARANGSVALDSFADLIATFSADVRTESAGE